MAKEHGSISQKIYFSEEKLPQGKGGNVQGETREIWGEDCVRTADTIELEV